MNRRQFIKSMFGTAAAIALTTVVKPTPTQAHSHTTAVKKKWPAKFNRRIKKALRHHDISRATRLIASHGARYQRYINS